MSLRLYRELVARARHFLRVSEFDVSEGRYDIALLHLERAAQLAIKAYLLRELGNLPEPVACTTWWRCRGASA